MRGEVLFTGTCSRLCDRDKYFNFSYLLSPNILPSSSSPLLEISICVSLEQEQKAHSAILSILFLLRSRTSICMRESNLSTCTNNQS